MKVFAFVKKLQNFNSEKGITPSPFGPISSHLYQKKKKHTWDRLSNASYPNTSITFSLGRTAK